MRTRVAVALAALLAVAGCASLPASGPVHRVAVDRSGRAPEAAYFSPPGPTRDENPGAVVSGFLMAMQANPLSTSVARSYLTEHAKASWRPSHGTIVYEADTVQATSRGVRVRLTDTRRLDSRGGWRGSRAGSETLDIHLVSENGQWRIDNPVDALVVPVSYFERSFARYDLYFYDQTGQVVLPDPVFIPRGQQTATNLVRGLLAGPGAALSPVTRSAVPPGTTLDLSVVVTESGIAEVPLSRDVLKASRQDLAHLVHELAWTLRQVPGVDRFRITVGGSPLPLPGGQADVPVTSGGALDAGLTGDRPATWGLSGGRVVDLGTSSTFPVPGPLGRPGYALRSLAVSDAPHQVAAVSRDGTTAYEAPADVSEPKARVRRIFASGTDLLRPAYDMFGDLWLLDRTSRGARLYVARGGRVREVVADGVTGAEVTGFSVARDGSRLALSLAGRGAVARVVDVLRTDEGEVTGLGHQTQLSADVTDGARVVDVGWRDAGTLALLARPSGDTSRVVLVSADGSPVASTVLQPSEFRGAATALVVAPHPEAPVRLVTADQRVFTLTGNGQWPHTGSRVLAAAYAP